MFVNDLKFCATLRCTSAAAVKVKKCLLQSQLRCIQSFAYCVISFSFTNASCRSVVLFQRSAAQLKPVKAKNDPPEMLTPKRTRYTPYSEAKSVKLETVTWSAHEARSHKV